MKKIICLGLLGTAQTAVPRRADSQRNRGVQQAMLRLVVQPLRAGAGKIPGDGRQVRIHFDRLLSSTIRHLSFSTKKSEIPAHLFLQQ